MASQRKIPPLDLPYWLLLISATVFGETGGDLLSQGLDLGYLVGTAIFLGLFFAAVSLQLWSRTEHPALYWLVILTTSTAGTTISDYLTRTLHLGYGGGALLLLACLGAVFAAWRLGGHVLAQDGAVPLPTEALYWCGILVASTLGTSFGDLIADASGLGFAGSSLLLAVLLVAVAVLQQFITRQRELFYWAAIVIVHPVGATAGDYLSKPTGLGLGPFWSSLILGLAFGAVVLGTVLTKRLPRK